MTIRSRTTVADWDEFWNRVPPPIRFDCLLNPIAVTTHELNELWNATQRGTVYFIHTNDWQTPARPADCSRIMGYPVVEITD
jgi:hypothetical protein